MTEMAQIENAVKGHIQQARVLSQTLQIENAQMFQLQNNPAAGELGQRQKDDLNKKMESQRTQLNNERTSFYQAWEVYRKMGGQIDYNSQFPNN